MENGCHDNPTLDVASDHQPVMQEEKPNTNGLLGGGDASGEDSNCWQVIESFAKKKTTLSPNNYQLPKCQKYSGQTKLKIALRSCFSIKKRIKNRILPV